MKQTRNGSEITLAMTIDEHAFLFAVVTYASVQAQRSKHVAADRMLDLLEGMAGTVYDGADARAAAIAESRVDPVDPVDPR
jgi:hypothetical protein